MNLLGSMGSMALFELGIQIIYAIFILFFIVKEARNFWKQRRTYFTEYWNWVELAIIGLSLMAMVMYVYRYIMVDKLLKVFAATAGNGYMKFQMVAYWNEQMLYGIGLLVFLATLKFIRILRFNKVIGLLGATLKYASTSLASFSIVFLLLFMAFNQFFYLTYQCFSQNFATMIQTVEQCLQMLIGKFNFSTFIQYSPILGTAFFLMYMVLCFFIMLTMFMAIMDEAFAAVREDMEKQSNEFEMVDYCVERFLRWTGLGAVFDKKKKENQNGDGSELLDYDDQRNYEDDVEMFPQRLDRLLDAISQVYFYHDTFESIFQTGGAGGGGGGKNALKGMMKGGKLPTSGTKSDNGVWNPEADRSSEMMRMSKKLADIDG